MNLIAKSDLNVDGRPIHMAPDRTQEIDVLAIAHRLWRRKLVILCLTVLLGTPAVAIILNLTPRYRAETQVVVDDRKLQVIGVADVLTGHTISEDTVLSEIQILSSRDLAKSVIARLDLKDDPEFNPSLQPPSRQQRWTAEVVSWLHELPFMPARKPVARVDETELETQIIDGFLGRLSIAPAGRSRVIRIIFESESPSKAALVSNTIADQYLENQVRAKTEAATNATKWLEEHLTEYRQKAEASRLKKEQYRQQAGLIPNGKGSTLLTQDVAAANEQLATAQARLSEAEARLAYVKKAVATSGGEATLSEIVQSQQIQSLRQQEATILRKIADLETKYGPKYPAIAQAQGELADLRRTIGRETDRIVQSLTTDVLRERSNVERLTALLDRYKSKFGASTEAEAKLLTLEQQQASYDTMFQLFLDRAKQTGLQADSQRPDAQIISRADAPTAPYFPNKRTLIPLATLTSLMLSTAAALALDRKKKGFVAIDQVHTALGSDTLGMMPHVKGMPRRVGLHGFQGGRRASAGFAEAVRSLHVRLLVASARPKVVMFASALPGEGKTTASAALALLMANIGRRAIIVDTDTRRPEVHRAFGVARGPGLTDYLSGEPLENVVQHVPDRDLDVIAAGRAVSHPADLLDSPRMRSLLTSLANQYDMVIVDSPPIMAVSDSLVVAPLVDKIVFMVRWARTPQPAAERALQLLTDAGADVVGTVLSMVNVERMAAEDPSYGYYRAVHRYYQET